MTYPAEVRTARMLLRQWRDSDAAAMHSIYLQPEVERQLVPMTYDDTVAQVATFAERWRTHGFSLWAAEDLATGTFLGRVGIMRAMQWPVEPGAVEVGWTFGSEHWGRGMATEGGRAALDAAFAHLDLDRVISFTRVTNVASRRVMEKLGLTERGRTDYKGIPHVWYDVTRAAP